MGKVCKGYPPVSVRYDAHHLYLPLQADPQEELLAAGAERPLPPPHCRQSDDRAVAFMGIEDGTLEMLFISPEERGKGLGKRLIEYGIESYSVERLAVNEQNPQAKGFYEHMCFHVYKRTGLDEQGNPYPLLYMSL